MAWLHSLRFCGHCGKQLPEGSTSRRLYCDDRCRVAAHRRRRVGVDLKTPKQPGKKLSPKT
jgi:NADH pyrophosphatase NudC (nudix superfamily)